MSRYIIKYMYKKVKAIYNFKEEGTLGSLFGYSTANRWWI
jgi:hypothetical protein